MEVQWSLVLFTAISGAGAWLFSSSMIQALAKKGSLPTKMESIISFVLLVVGGFASVTHLKHVDRIFEALNRPTSGIFIEAAFVGVLCVLIAVYFIMLVRNSSEGGRKVVGVIAMVAGIAFAFACGSSYLMGARAAWVTYALPLAYCTTAGAAGAGLNMLTKAIEKQGGEAVSFAGLIEAVVAIAALICCAAFIVPAGDAIVEGGAGLWAAVTFVCALAGIALGAYTWKKSPEGVGLVAVVVAVGFVCAIALRVAMWLIGTPVFDFFMMPLG